MDMVPFYLRALKIEEKYPSIRFEYWLEEKFKTEVFSRMLKIMSNLSTPFDFFSLMAMDWLNEHKFSSPQELKKFIFESDFRKLILASYERNSQMFDLQIEMDQQQVQYLLELERQANLLRRTFSPNF